MVYAPAALYPPGTFLVLTSVQRMRRPHGHTLREELGILKKSMTSSGIEPANFRLVAYCLNQLRYRMPLFYGEPTTVGRT
jgi:hypothetical protein